jgi:hypothetical protein
MPILLLFYFKLPKKKIKKITIKNKAYHPYCILATPYLFQATPESIGVVVATPMDRLE